jgi:ATP-binding cassette subfamily C protein CydC
MSALWQVFMLIWREQRRAMLRGAVLGLLVLLAGGALLGLSGWFITAAAAAGIAGTGAVFDTFRPSALVRFLALGRGAARYGERVLTHDATLLALAALRVRLLAAHARAPYDSLVRLRGAQVLNRLTADVDALDGVPLRLILPVLAGLLTQAVAGLALWALVGGPVALWLSLGFTLGGTLVIWRGTRAALAPAFRAETAAQVFRSRLIDLVQAREELAVLGRLLAQRDLVMAAETRRNRARRALDRAERLAGLALSAWVTLLATGALGLGMVLPAAPALAAAGFFAALGLAETLTPLRRLVAEIGRMALAARRVTLALTPQASAGGKTSDGAGLRLEAAGFRRDTAARAVVKDLSLDLRPGQTIALAGPSGGGKSTVLLMAAGLLPPTMGRITLGGLALDDWQEPALRDRLVLVPQRVSLMSGTIREALTLSAPAPDAALWQALNAVCLGQVIATKGGLDLRLGPHGAGLSGGETRRLALARALMRAPDVLLLDEPTEGLDEPTARAVLSGIRQHLPQAAILMASHRQSELDWAEAIITLGGVVD